MGMELIDLSAGEIPKELQDDLDKIRKAKYEEALRNLITGKTPDSAIRDRPVRGMKGSKVDYVTGHWMAGQANALLGHMWSTEVIDHGIMEKEKQIWAKIKVSVTLPGRTITRTEPDGTKIETKYDSVTILKTQFGGSAIKYPREGPQVPIDIGDDLKSATTDGMKKCLAVFGIASDVYGEREKQAEASPGLKQLLTLYTVGLKYGMDQEKVENWIREQTGKEPDELVELETLSLIQEIRKMQPESKE